MYSDINIQYVREESEGLGTFSLQGKVTEKNISNTSRKSGLKTLSASFLVFSSFSQRCFATPPPQSFVKPSFSAVGGPWEGSDNASEKQVSQE